MKFLRIYLFLGTLLLLEAQSLDGWKTFVLPGLPEEEQYILEALLSSDDTSLALTALAELRTGVTTGRISAQSPEYSEFLGELVKTTRIRPIDRGTGLQKVISESPLTLLTLVDLVFPLSESFYLDYLATLLETREDPIILQHVAEKMIEYSKPLSPEIVPFFYNELRSQGQGSHPLDQGFIYALLDLLTYSYQNFSQFPDEILIEPLFRVRDRTQDTRLRNEIYRTLESIYLY